MFKKIGSWLGRHRKVIVIVAVSLLLLVTTSVYSYKLGQKDAQKAANKGSNISTLLKNLPKKPATSQKNTPANLAAINSGFFRLNGAVTKVEKNTLYLKLANDSTLSLHIKDDQTYLSDSNKIAASKIPKNTNVIATGTISSDGTFNVTVISSKATKY